MEQDKLASDAAVFLDTHADWEKMTQQEIGLLRAKNFEAAKAVMKIKAPVAERYQKQLKQLFDQKERLMALPIAIKEALRKSQFVFENLSAEYQIELDLALDASRRFIELIKNAVTQQNTSSHFYGYSGAMVSPTYEVRSMVYNAKA